jgi:TetR/AcrR family transcriptional repressor of mexJK operon
MGNLAEIPTDNRTRLIEAATAAVLQDGYHVSVDRIAALAGVAKQTLYNHFSSKAELFGEVVRHVTATILVPLEEEGRPLRERLMRFAIAFRERALSPEGIAFYRTVASEARRFPDLSASFYANGFVQSTDCLSKLFDNAMNQEELRRDDPKLAARLLISMLVESERSRMLFTDPDPSPPSTDDAARIVNIFLRAYTPN